MKKGFWIISLMLLVVYIATSCIDQKLETFEFESVGSKYKITKYNGDVATKKVDTFNTVVIPEFYFNSVVYRIDDNLFENSNISTIKFMGANITEIGKNAFANTKNLKSISLPRALKVIEENAFKDASLEGELVIPDTVEKIESGAFEGTSLKKVFIPKSVKTIAQNAFAVKTPKNLTVVTESKDPSFSVNWLPSEASLKTDTTYELEKKKENIVIRPDISTTFDSFLYEIEKDSCTILGLKPEFANVEKITIPSGYKDKVITKIANFAFKDNKKINQLEFNTTELLEIGDSAFENCTGLTDIFLPKSLNIIGNNAFKGIEVCTVEIYDAKIIGKNAFDYIPEDNNYEKTKFFVKVLTKPAGWVGDGTPASVPDNSWHGHIPHTFIYFGKSASDSQMFTYDEEGTTITGLRPQYKFSKTVVIPKRYKNKEIIGLADNAFINSKIEKLSFEKNITALKTIGESCFEGSPVSSNIILPESVTVIKAKAFKDLNKLHGEIRIPKGIQEIGYSAFENCKLTNTDFNLDNYFNLKTVGTSAFKDCGLSGTINLSKKVQFGDSVFENCKSITEIIISDKYEVVNKKMFKGASGVESLIFSNNLKEIGEYAFEGCISLKSMLLRLKNVTTIKKGAFAKSQFQSVYIPSTVITIEDFAFNINPNTSVIALAITEDESKIAKYAFGDLWHGVYPSNQVKWKDVNYKNFEIFKYDEKKGELLGLKEEFSNIEKIKLPNTTPNGKNITSIATEAFINKTNLLEVDFSDMHHLETIGANAFSHCNKIQSTLNLPETVKEIGVSAFQDCNKIKGIVLPENLTTISSNAFKNCELATGNLVLNSLKTLGSSAFENCKSIIRIDLHKSPLTSINNSTFLNCSKVVNILMGDSIRTIGSQSFKGCMSLKYININKDIDTIGESAFEGCKSLSNDLIIPDNIENIAKNTFKDTLKLKSVKFNKKLVEIGESAFENSGISNQIIITDSLTTIRKRAFANCVNLRDTEFYIGKFVQVPGKRPMFIPKSLNIEEEAFKGAKFRYVFIPEEQKILNREVFALANDEDSSINCQIKRQDSFNKDKFSYYYEGTIDNLENSWYGKFNSEQVYWNKNGYGNSDEFIYGYVEREGNPKAGYKIISINPIKDDNGKYVYEDIEALDIPRYYWGENDIKKLPILEIGDSAFYSKYTEKNKVKLSKVKSIKFNRCLDLEKIGTRAFSSNRECFSNEIKYRHKNWNGLIKENNESRIFNLLLPIDGIELRHLKKLKEIGDNAFRCLYLTDNAPFSLPNCDEYNEIKNESFYKLKSVKKYEIGKEIKKENEGFIDNIIIPNSVISIGERAFYGTDFARFLVLPPSVKTIKIQAFKDSKKLKLESTLDLSNVTELGEGAFENCESLDKNIILPEIKIYNNNLFFNCENIKGDLIIPDTVTEIGAYTFRNMKNLDGELKMSKYIEKIGHDTFRDARKLKGDLVLPDTLKFIGARAFRDCISLDGNIRLPENDEYTTVLNGTFYNLKSIKGDLVIPKNITKLESEAFISLGIDGNLILNDGITYYGHYALSGILNGKVLGDLELKNCEYVGSKAFSNLNIDGEISFGDKLGHIGDRAFMATSFRGDLILPDSVKKIGNRAFASSAKLIKTLDSNGKEKNIPNYKRRLRLPENDFYTTIEEGTFSSCYLIDDLYIPNNITRINNMAFQENYFTSSNFPNNVTEVGYGIFVNNIHLTLNNNDVLDLSKLINTEIPNSIFYNCKSIENSKLIFPKNIKKIGNNSFREIKIKGELNIPETVEEIGMNAFYGSKFTGSLKLPSNIKRIGIYAFRSASDLTGDLIIPDKVEYIGYGAFQDTNLNGTIHLPNNPKYTKINTNCFSGAYINGPLEVPNNIIEIDHYAFHNCNFDSIKLSKNLVRIGNRAFYAQNIKSKDLKAFELTLPESIREIGDSFMCRVNPNTKIKVPFRKGEEETLIGYDFHSKWKGIGSGGANIKETNFIWKGDE